MKIKRSELIQLANRYIGNDSLEAQNQIMFKIATARAARISYTTLGDNPKIDYEADIKLHDRLLESKHLSCFEHCAKVMSGDEYYSFVKGEIPTYREEDGTIFNQECYPKELENTDRFGWCNNFRGFIQYRYLIENQ